MGTVYRMTKTVAIPAGATFFTRKGQRFARWKNRNGRTRTEPVITTKEGRERLLIENPYFHAEYRDGKGHKRREPTGCRDETAAKQKLAELERRAELVRARVMTPEEDAVSEHQASPLQEQLDAFGQHLEAKGASQMHRDNTRRQLERVARECLFHSLADLNAQAFERWLTQRDAEGMSARNRNAHRESLVAFANWCIRAKRLTHNPFRDVPKANQKADPRRQRRAMTEEQMDKLLAVARERPLLDAITVRRGPRKGERYANVRPEVRERLEHLGWERVLIYKTYLLTGLRKGELASVTVAQVQLDGELPGIQLNAADEKNREGNFQPLRADLVADLREWLADKLARLQAEARQAGLPIPIRLPPNTPLFYVPGKLRMILDRDLKAAGIPKRDDRGRTLDVHALRHTFATQLARSGAPQRTTQKAMRHGTMDMANVYTDPALLDVHGALDKLPALSLARKPEHSAATATSN
jgi:site-specific recombinase XerD